ncbi:MAG: FAD-dependent oxidoreductase [Actinomycetota bacterium]|nr:FAD-dependent oxidoreductase [Actinomycetota bacterium]
MHKKHVVILGAGFAGLELAARLSDSLADEVRVTLIDQNDAFSFGYSKLDVLFGRKATVDVLLPYDEIAKEGVQFNRECVTSIEPETRHVTTDRQSYDADVLVVALGADYDFAATPGFEEGGFEYYSLAGAERMRDALPEFESGTILIGILGQPFKCPPAPFEGALLLHDYLVQRGIRKAAEIRVIGPMAAPVPIAKQVSQSILDALRERAIEYVPNQHITGLDTRTKNARLASGRSAPYDLFVGIPVHRVPQVVETSGLAVDGWIPVDPTNLATRFADVYAVGDVTGAPVAKAGVFAESAAAVVADDIAARLRGDVLQRPWDGAGNCYIEFGGGAVGKVEANFLGGPTPTARLVGPSPELAADKEAFGATRRERWFGRSA